MELYRPQWTCGRHHKNKKGSWAIMYNLLESMAYFFEDDSADIIQSILRFTKDEQVPLSELQKNLDPSLTEEDLKEFVGQLIDAGLLTQGQLEPEIISTYRKSIGEKRIKQTVKVEKTVQEKLPFVQDDAENAYMEVLDRDRIPFVVMFELTYSCNEKCIHCFNPGASRNDNEISERKREEITIEHYEQLLNDLKELGTVKIILTGGEPFIKKDIWKLIELITEKDFALDIYTNGQNLLGRTERIAKYYPRSIGLSIYSAVNDVHDSITRIPGSLLKTLKVAEELTAAGVPLFFKCPIMFHNAKSYFTVAELAKRFGAMPQFDITLTDSVDGDRTISKNLQVGGELLEVILRDPNIPLYVGPEAPNFGRVERDKHQAFCGAGTNLMNITPEGFVTPCNSFPTQFGNLRETSFKLVWENSVQLRKWQGITINDYEECEKYEICGYCNRCPGQSLVEHGTPLKISSANCRTATARMNLAKKLRDGNDPLLGKKIEERIVEVEANFKEEIIKEMGNDYRNKELNLL